MPGYKVIEPVDRWELEQYLNELDESAFELVQVLPGDSGISYWTVILKEREKTAPSDADSKPPAI